MIIEYTYDVDLEKVAKSGQCFRLHREGMYYRYGPNVVMQLSSRRLWVEDNIGHIFQQTTDYSHIEATMRNHSDYMRRCVEAGHGMLILNQPLFETIISFIISQNNNIKRIEHIISKLCRGLHSPFPTRDELLVMSVQDWEDLGVGYRAPYLHKAVSLCDSNFLDNLIDCRSTEQCLELLRSIPGVGPKVANCIALFGLQRYDAFPIDVWIKRIIDEQFNGYFDITWCHDFAGIVQQYMFYYGRIK